MNAVQFGKLHFEPVSQHRDLVGGAVWQAIEAQQLHDTVLVAEINPELADTEAFCKEYNIGLDVSANCVVVKARRAERTWYAACMILATDWVDVNKAVKKYLDARKISFAPMEEATELSSMEYGGITPIGLPDDWTILVDESVVAANQVIIGSGLRGSKILIKSQLLSELPTARVMDIKKR